MTSKLTIEQTQQIIDAADAVITALAGTNDEVHKDDTDKMVRLWDDLNDRYAPPEVVRELARMALSAMDSEPVAWIVHARTGDQLTTDGGYVANAEGILGLHSTPLYRHAQPAVDSDFIPKNLDRALGVVGVALPESREEFNLQAERWIQRLIDRVIRYADEFQEQPAPVVPDNRAITKHLDDIALETAKDVMFDVNRRHEFLGGDIQLLSRIQCRIDSACRAAMLQAGNSPVIPEGYVMVPINPTGEMQTAGGIAVKCETTALNKLWTANKVYQAMLAAAPQEVKP